MMMEENKNIRELTKSLGKWDDLIDTKIPTVNQIKVELQKHQIEIQKAFYKELMLFGLVACVVLASILTLLIKLTVIFVVIQLLILLVLPLFIYMEKRRMETERNYL
jgi:Flp pilus assembly protein TadB